MADQWLIYPALQEPVLTAAQRPEDVTESRWHQPLSEPTRRRALATAVVVASGLFAAPFTPAPPVDSWFAKLSEPVRQRSLPVAEQQASAFLQAETVSPDKWLVQLSEPRRSRAGASQAFLAAPPFADTISVRWHQPLAEPLRRPFAVAYQPSATFLPVVTAPATVSIDSWFAPLAQPVRLELPTAPSFQSSLPFDDGTPVVIDPNPVPRQTLTNRGGRRSLLINRRGRNSVLLRRR